MPTSRKQVPNTALAGNEVREVIRLRCDELLANFGILAPNIAFSRLAFSIRIDLHVDNAFARDHSIGVDSRPVATNIVAKRPELAAIEAPPLAAPSADSAVLSLTLDSRIDSPNAERVRLGLPVPVVTKAADGTRQVEHVKYPPDPTLGDADVAIRDSSEEARAAWGLPPMPAVPESPVAAAAAPVYEADPLDNEDNAKVPR